MPGATARGRDRCRPTSPDVADVYGENRQGVHPRSHLANFTGVLHVAGHAGFDRPASR